MDIDFKRLKQSNNSAGGGWTVTMVKTRSMAQKGTNEQLKTEKNPKQTCLQG